MNSLTVPNSILLEEVAAVLDRGREAVITPTGNSMLPFLRGGALPDQDRLGAFALEDGHVFRLKA